MLLKLKRIYSYYVELLAISVICFFGYEVISGIALASTNFSNTTSMIMYMYIKWIFLGIIITYSILRNIIGGQSILQKIFGIKHEYKNKKSLILKNILDLITLPITLITVLIYNKSIGDIITNTSIIEASSNKSINPLIYFIMIWFTVIPLILIMAVNWRINKTSDEFIYHLNNIQTIKDNVGIIEKFTLDDKLFWSGYDKDGQFIGAKIINEENQKYKIKIYLGEESNTYSHFIINGERYEYEIEKFSFEEFKSTHEEELNSYNDEIEVSKINNEREASSSAREAYRIKYPDKPFNYRGNLIYYDEVYDYYMINFTTETNYKSYGEYCTIIIDSNGKVHFINLNK